MTELDETALRFDDGAPAGMLVKTTAFERTGIDPIPLLKRHLAHDWGEVSQEDRDMNNQDVGQKGRLHSVYKIDGTEVWIITDDGHEVTTVLLPDDY